ncbi:unnamed protein product [Calypogeia fissa]
MAGELCHGVVPMRSSKPIRISSQSHSSISASLVFCPLHSQEHSIAPRNNPNFRTVSAGAINAGLVRQRQQLQYRRGFLLPKTSCRSSSSFEFAHPFTSSSKGLPNFWNPESIHNPFRPRRKMSQNRLHFIRAGVEEAVNDNEVPFRTRKVLEHVVLFKMQDTMTEEQEKEMLDSLWSLQYQVKNVLCTTVGRLVQKTPEGFTHALFSRFPNKQAVDDYMESPTRWRVAQDLVIPYYLGLMMVDFEGEVEDDIETVFRRGDDFQEGVEHFLFFRFKDNVSSDAVDKFLNTANSLPAKFGELVQLTVGANFQSQSKGTYTHGLVARLPSGEAYAEFEDFLQADPSWIEAMELLETSQTLTANFLVSPVGKTVM